MSGVGHAVEEAHRVCDIVEATIAEAKWVHGAVESKVALLMAQAKARTAHVVGVLSECVQEAAAHSEVQVSHVVDAVSQQQEKGLEAVTTSATVTSE